MAHVISVVNQKGGVGKTTTTVSVASLLHDLFQKRVLVVDLDPQANATSGLGIEKNTCNKCIYDVLISSAEISDVIQSTEPGGLSVLPSSIQLAGAEIELVGELSRETKLKRALSPVLGYYDYILIDCPPSLGLLTINALTACSKVLVPLQCEYFALEGLSQLLHTIQLVEADLNPQIQILGILLTMANHRTNLTSQIIEEVHEHFPEHVFNTVISRNVRISEAPSHGIPINRYDPKASGTQHYSEFTQELVECLHPKEHSVAV
ncbi:ParA family protein [bacterium]|mgnify:FL=1|jgi:chromosome partitioning protein|nr:ParA family protein [bacterium]